LGKAAGAEADLSLPTSAKVKKTWIYTTIPPYAFRDDPVGQPWGWTIEDRLWSAFIRVFNEHQRVLPQGKKAGA
jgi:hypothetical protein